MARLYIPHRNPATGRGFDGYRRISKPVDEVEVDAAECSGDSRVKLLRRLLRRGIHKSCALLGQRRTT